MRWAQPLEVSDVDPVNAQQHRPSGLRHVDTQVRSDTHNASGRLTVKSRFTWSAGRSAPATGAVVFTCWPRTVPCSPIRRIRRATVQRATDIPSRKSWRHTLCPIDPEVLVVHPANLPAQPLVATHPGRTALRLRFAPLGLVVRRWGDRQLGADRPDPVSTTMFADERRHHLARRSSSAWAKYADALRRISFARRSSRTSRSSSLNRRRSSLVSPHEPRGRARPVVPTCEASPRCTRSSTTPRESPTTASHVRPDGPRPASPPVPAPPGSIS